ncbi:MAG: hypothetical protein AB8U44_04050 [Aaplasma endosymbiont of Hyalomma asiaticum]
MLRGRIGFWRFSFGLLLVLVEVVRAASVHASGFYASVGLGGGLPDFDPAETMKIERLIEQPVSLGDSVWAALRGMPKYRPEYMGESSFRGELGYRQDHGGVLGLEVVRDSFRVRGALRDNDCEERLGRRRCFGIKRRVSGPRGQGDVVYETAKFTARDPGVVVEAITVNVCQTPMRHGDYGLVLYGCVKAGIGTVEAWGVRGKLRPLMGCKVGAEFRIRRKISVYGEAYYHGLSDMVGKVGVERNGKVNVWREMIKTELRGLKYVGGTWGLRVAF